MEDGRAIFANLRASESEVGNYVSLGGAVADAHLAINPSFHIPEQGGAAVFVTSDEYDRSVAARDSVGIGL